MQVFMTQHQRTRKRSRSPPTDSTATATSIEELSNVDDGPSDGSSMWESSDIGSPPSEMQRHCSPSKRARRAVAEITDITCNRSNMEAYGMQSNKMHSLDGSGTVCDLENGEQRCRVCEIALSGKLARAQALKYRQENNGDDDSNSDGVEWTVHNGVASLCALWQMYRSAERWGGRRELCAAIAEHWNSLYHVDQVAESEDLDGNLSRIGESVLSVDAWPNAEADALEADEANEEEDVISALYPGAGGETLYSNASFGGRNRREQQQQHSSAYDREGEEQEVHGDEATVEGLDDAVDVRITEEDVYQHFKRCTDSPTEVLSRDLRELSMIQDVLLRRHVLVQAQDDDIVDVDDGDGGGSLAPGATEVAAASQSQAPVREEINKEGLYMYLALIATKRQVAETTTRGESTAIPSAYSMMTLRSAIASGGASGGAITNGGAKSGGSSRSKNSIGQLSGV